MTNAALVDLKNRIASNTLTFAQQTVLANALNVVAPLFPTIDETSVAVPSVDDVLVRDLWIAPLYALAAQAAGGTAVDPRTVTNWYVSTSSGSDSNTGTSAGSPLHTLAALGAIWRGAQPGGGRATLTPGTGTTITIHLLDAHDPNDPAAPCLDVDLAEGCTLLFLGGTSVVHTGALTTVSAFTRTSAGGQIVVTDGTVADFSTLVGLMVQDTTKGTVGWVYGPDGSSSANGDFTCPYAAQTAGDIVDPPAQINYAAADAYTVSTLFTLALGTGWTTRSYPQGSPSGGLPAQVVFYRCALEQAVVGASDPIDSPFVTFALQESSIEGNALVVQNTTALLLLNSLVFHATVSSESASEVECFFGGGVVGANFFVLEGGNAIVDRDFLVSGGAYEVSSGGSLSLGTCAHFGTTGPALIVDGGGTCIQVGALSGVGLLYGTSGATSLEVTASQGQGAALLYYNDSSGTPAQNAFKLSNGVCALGKASQANGFGFNEGSGAIVGPTAVTLAHLDAALAAGTGFGSAAIDPATGCAIRIAA